jgi:hypothetical protein
MLPFGVTIPATVLQRSEIPEGFTNYAVYRTFRRHKEHCLPPISQTCTFRQTHSLIWESHDINSLHNVQILQKVLKVVHIVTIGPYLIVNWNKLLINYPKLICRGWTKKKVHSHTYATILHEQWHTEAWFPCYDFWRLKKMIKRIHFQLRRRTLYFRTLLDWRAGKLQVVFWTVSNKCCVSLLNFCTSVTFVT